MREDLALGLQKASALFESRLRQMEAAKDAGSKNLAALQGRILQLPLNCMAQDQELATLRERASAALCQALWGV